jgi:hypothetical protein
VIKNSPNSYTDIALTVNKDLGDGLTASVAAISTTGNVTKYKANSATSYDASKNALVVGVKYSF